MVKFELRHKAADRETTIVSDDSLSLLSDMYRILRDQSNLGGKLTGARGEIEIGIEGAGQVRFRVL